MKKSLNPFYFGYMSTCNLANSKDPLCGISSGSALFAKIKKKLTEMHYNLEISICDQFYIKKNELFMGESFQG